MDINPSTNARNKSKNTNPLGYKGITFTNKEVNHVASSSRSAHTGPDISRLELKEGQTIKGEVIDLRFHEVKIVLEPSKQVITAKLSGDVPIFIGQSADFMVVEVSQGKLALRMIPQEDQLNLDITLQKALTASGLPINQRNKEIVHELLKNQLPIDRNTLQTLVKASVTNRDTKTQLLVMMYKHHIPISPSNIRQLEAYQNGTHQLLTEIKKIAGNLSELPPANIPLEKDNQETGDLIRLTKDIEEVIEHVPDLSKLHTTSQEDKSSVSTPTPINIIPYTKEMALGTFLNEKDLTLLGNALAEKIKDVSTFTSVQQAELTSLIKSGTMPFYEVVKLIDQLYPTNQVSDPIMPANLVSDFISTDTPAADIINSIMDEYTKQLGEALHKRWTITPDKISKKEPVKELYKNLQTDLEKLSEMMKSGKEADGPTLQESMGNLKNNLQFMRALNDIIPYVQLPIRFQDREVHGDFYVFHKKNALHNKKDILNVLLHLDMDELGPINLHMKMEQDRIQAVFSLQDEVSGQIISEHLNELCDALAKKGYQFQARVEQSETETNFVEDILNHDSADSSAVRYSFDIRA